MIHLGTYQPGRLGRQTKPPFTGKCRNDGIVTWLGRNHHGAVSAKNCVPFSGAAPGL